MKVWHLTFSSDGRFPLFQSEEARRGAVRKLVRHAGGELLLYSVVDDHVHVVIACQTARKGRICAVLLRALRGLSAVEILPAHQRSVGSRSHMSWLVRYLVQQVSHHGLEAHPALWSGSCYQDLVGARRMGGFQLGLGRVLPRLSQAGINEMVGLPRRRVQPADDDAMREAGAAGLVEAAASALAVGPDLVGRPAPVVQAKRAVAHMAADLGLASREIAVAMDLTTGGVGFLRRSPVDGSLFEAMRVRVALHRAVQGQGG